MALRMRSRLRLAVALLAGLLSVDACSRKVTTVTGPVTIRVNTTGLTGEGGLFIAYDKGYFKNRGLNVVLVPAASSSGADNLTMLAGNQLDVASFSPSAALFNMMSRGVGVTGLVALNAAGADDYSSGIVIRQDLVRSGRYRSPADLKGMTLATGSYGGLGHFNIFKALALGHVDNSQARIELLNFPASIVALSNKAIDGAYETEPYLHAALAGGGVLEIPAHVTAPGAPTAVMFVSNTFLQQHRDATVQFLAALLQGQSDYLQAVETGAGRSAMLESLQRHTSIKDIAKLKALNLPHVSADGRFSTASLDDFQNFFLGLGLQKTRVDSGKVFDASLLNEALALRQKP